MARQHLGAQRAFQRLRALAQLVRRAGRGPAAQHSAGVGHRGRVIEVFVCEARQRGRLGQQHSLGCGAHVGSRQCRGTARRRYVLRRPAAALLCGVLGRGDDVRPLLPRGASPSRQLDRAATPNAGAGGPRPDASFVFTRRPSGCLGARGGAVPSDRAPWGSGFVFSVWGRQPEAMSRLPSFRPRTITVDAQLVIVRSQDELTEEGTVTRVVHHGHQQLDRENEEARPRPPQAVAEAAGRVVPCAQLLLGAARCGSPARENPRAARPRLHACFHMQPWSSRLGGAGAHRQGARAEAGQVGRESHARGVGRADI